MTRPLTVLCDIDGTLADTRHLHYLAYGEHADYEAFHSLAQHAPAIEWVVSEVRGLPSNYLVVLVTARQEKFRKQTIEWLVNNRIYYNSLWMRPDGDGRPDYLVKQEVLRVLEKEHDIVRAYDDNPSTVRLWLENQIPTVVVPGWGE